MSKVIISAVSVPVSALIWYVGYSVWFSNTDAGLGTAVGVGFWLAVALTIACVVLNVLIFTQERRRKAAKVRPVVYASGTSAVVAAAMFLYEVRFFLGR